MPGGGGDHGQSGRQPRSSSHWGGRRESDAGSEREYRRRRQPERTFGEGSRSAESRPRGPQSCPPFRAEARPRWSDTGRTPLTPRGLGSARSDRGENRRSAPPAAPCPLYRKHPGVTGTPVACARLLLRRTGAARTGVDAEHRVDGARPHRCRGEHHDRNNTQHGREHCRKRNSLGEDCNRSSSANCTNHRSEDLVYRADISVHTSTMVPTRITPALNILHNIIVAPTAKEAQMVLRRENFCF